MKNKRYRKIILSLDDEIVGEVITSTGMDENALLVEAGNIKINGAEVNRESSASTGGDNASFYGVGATVLCTGGQQSSPSSLHGK